LFLFFVCFCLSSSSLAQSLLKLLPFTCFNPKKRKEKSFVVLVIPWFLFSFFCICLSFIFNMSCYQFLLIPTSSIFQFPIYNILYKYFCVSFLLSFFPSFFPLYRLLVTLNPLSCLCFSQMLYIMNMRSRFLINNSNKTNNKSYYFKFVCLFLCFFFYLFEFLFFK
jgi:hypothetical protein